MAIVERGNRDVNVTGVVGSTTSSKSDKSKDDSPKDDSPKGGKAHTGVTHLGKGSVNITRR